MSIFGTRISALSVMLWLCIVSVVCGSEYDTSLTLNKNQFFWNVEGSTNDKLPSGYTSWIDLWLQKTGGIKQCYAQGQHNNIIYGGHVVLDPSLIKPWYGAGDVYIVPICNYHNNQARGEMKLNSNVVAVKLKNYKL